MIFQCIQVDNELQSSEKATPVEINEISENKLGTQLDQDKSKLVESKTKTKKVIKKKSKESESFKLENEQQVKDESRSKASENKDVCLVFKQHASLVFLIAIQ